MKSHWRKILSMLPSKIERNFYSNFFKKEHELWEKNGKKLPVSNYSKHLALINLQKKYDLKTLIETGTYLGDTLFALALNFEALHSIELSDFYYQKAKLRFSNNNKIQLLNGDSGQVLKELVPKLKSPALFWLDGHYSGGLTAKGELECPVYEELNSIFSSPFKHVIVIDDARLFNGTNDYPQIDKLKLFIEEKMPEYKFSLANDSIILEP